MVLIIVSMFLPFMTLHWSFAVSFVSSVLSLHSMDLASILYSVQLVRKSAGLLIERLRVRIPAGKARDFSFS